jgi:exodeoxyribonuclease-3
MRWDPSATADGSDKFTNSAGRGLFLKVATWNVNSVLARLPIVKRWLDMAQPDVLCMQETKCSDDRFPSAEFAELGYKSEAFGQRSYNGVAILSRTKCGEVQRGFPADEEGAHARLLALTTGGVRFINVYIPNGAFVGSEKYGFKLDWMRRLRLFFDEHYETGTPILLCGDFNVAPEERDVHDPRLWQGRIMFSEQEREALSNLKDWGFTDAFRMHTEDAGFFTWWDYRAGAFRRNAGLRIDHIWLTTPLALRCRSSWIDKEPRKWERPSDHAPVVAEFD